MRLPGCCRRLDTKSGGNRDHLGQSMADCTVSMSSAAVLTEWLVPRADPFAGRLGCAAGSTRVATRQQSREQMSMTSSETRRTSVDHASADARRSLPPTQTRPDTSEAHRACAGSPIWSDCSSLTSPRRPPWSPELSGLDYGQHGPTGATALVCLRGSGSRAVMAEDGVCGLISCVWPGQ
jgi:hypothetical protein